MGGWEGGWEGGRVGEREGGREGGREGERNVKPYKYDAAAYNSLTHRQKMRSYTNDVGNVSREAMHEREIAGA